MKGLGTRHYNDWLICLLIIILCTFALIQGQILFFYFVLRMDHNDFFPVHVLLAVLYTCIVLIDTHTSRHILHDNNNIIVVLTLVSNFVYMNVYIIHNHNT